MPAFIEDRVERGEKLGLAEADARRLARRYGTNVDLVSTCSHPGAIGRRNTGLSPDVYAEIEYGLRHEMVVTPSDFFIRQDRRAVLRHRLGARESGRGHPLHGGGLRLDRGGGGAPRPGTRRSGARSDDSGGGGDSAPAASWGRKRLAISPRLHGAGVPQVQPHILQNKARVSCGPGDPRLRCVFAVRPVFWGAPGRLKLNFAHSAPSHIRQQPFTNSL